MSGGVECANDACTNAVHFPGVYRLCVACREENRLRAESVRAAILAEGQR